jgi:hypothetical protein
MYREQEPRDEIAAAISSEKQFATRIGTISKPELAQSRNGTPVTFAARQRFITLRQPLENMRRLSPTRQTKFSSRSDLQERGFRDGWDEEFFSR